MGLLQSLTRVETRLQVRNPISENSDCIGPRYDPRTDAETALVTVTDWMSDSTSSQNAMVSLIAGLVYVAEENFTDALKACHQGRSLEQMALCVQV
jgi:hypothetical protein